ncbi:hypothetical protein GCM10010435_17690 [Winogradskya consettensis]|uniref:Uncharacterized protein n=1 Tax=Winogradskya consettensis TaxID=113560 RepID=A0A919SWY3_9ACTN|nr:hypothetical protein Aco04nite_61360 [Actinoplanes consettensis]
MHDRQAVLFLDPPVMRDPSARVFDELDRPIAVCGLRRFHLDDQKNLVGREECAVRVVVPCCGENVWLDAISLVEPDGDLSVGLDAGWGLCFQGEFQCGDDTGMP